MKTIIALNKLLSLIAILSILDGCSLHKTYSGAYFITKCSSKHGDNKLKDEIYFSTNNIANDFGFIKQDKRHTDQYYDEFLKTKNKKGNYDHINGYDSVISLIFMKDPLSITIRDYTIKYETPFIAKLKMEIENKLKEVCAIQPLFQRDSELGY